jgi:hypothetical protein
VHVSLELFDSRPDLPNETNRRAAPNGHEQTQPIYGEVGEREPHAKKSAGPQSTHRLGVQHITEAVRLSMMEQTKTDTPRCGSDQRVLQPFLTSCYEKRTNTTPNRFVLDSFDDDL